MTSAPVINPPSDSSTPPPPVTPRPRSTVLWVLLLVGVLANVTTSALLDDVWVSSATGVLVLACVAGLVLRARSGRTGA